MVWGMFLKQTLGFLIPFEHHLNVTAFRSIVADHIHPFMATIYTTDISSIIMPHVPRQKSLTDSMNMIMSSMWDVVEQGRLNLQLTNLQQLCNVIMST